MTRFIAGVVSAGAVNCVEMKNFVRIFLLVLPVFWAAGSVQANTLKERLRQLSEHHEQSVEETSDASLGRLARRHQPDDEEGGMFTKEFLATVPEVEGDKEWRCMSEALYFEARGEGIEGQFAVAEVILNRMKSSKFPDTICGVVNQGSGNGRYRCQFTYTCDGKLEIISEMRAWSNVGKVAMLAIEGDVKELTSGATYYHTNYVNPSWSRKFARTTTIGVHHFYKEPDRVSLR